MDRRRSLDHRIVLMAALCAVLGLCGPVEAKNRTRNASVDPHCGPDASAPPANHQLKCSIPGPGKFDIGAEATFKNGTDADAALNILLDGEACGKSETVKFSGRGDVYGTCNMKKLTDGPHDLRVGVDFRMATYDDLHVTVTQHDAAPRHEVLPVPKGGFTNGR